MGISRHREVTSNLAFIEFRAFEAQLAKGTRPTRTRQLGLRC